jgi:hypothetical protein
VVHKHQAARILIFLLSKAILDAYYQYTLTFMFQSMFTLQFDGALSLYEMYDIVKRCLTLPLLLHWLVEERNWVGTHRSVSQRVVD